MVDGRAKSLPPPPSEAPAGGSGARRRKQATGGLRGMRSPGLFFFLLSNPAGRAGGPRPSACEPFGRLLRGAPHERRLLVGIAHRRQTRRAADSRMRHSSPRETKQNEQRHAREKVVKGAAMGMNMTEVAREDGYLFFLRPPLGLLAADRIGKKVAVSAERWLGGLGTCPQTFLLSLLGSEF